MKMEESLWVKLNLPICEDVRNQEKDTGISYPALLMNPGGIEAFVKDGILAEGQVCG